MNHDYFVKKRASIIIHCFAVAHAATALACSQLLIADKVILTGLTTAMILSLASICKVKMDQATAVTTAALIVCEFLGVYAAVLLVQWIPFIGNAANSAATFTVTEIMGWGIYRLFSIIGDDTSIWEGLSAAEKKRLIKEALKGADKLARDEKKRIKTLLQKLSPEDRKEYERIEKKMRKIKIQNFKNEEEKKAAEEEQLLLISELNDLLNKYDFENT